MATVIRTDGSEYQIEPENGSDFSLEELRSIVNGHIELLSFPNNKYMVINEEGKLLGLPENKRGTLMARQCGIQYNDYVVGNILICKKDQIV